MNFTRPSHEDIGECKYCHKICNVSRRRICVDCGNERAIIERKQLKGKKGEYFDKWKKGIIAGVEKATKGK